MKPGFGVALLIAAEDGRLRACCGKNFSETPGLQEYMSFKFWLEDGLGRRVDLVMKGALKSWAQPVVEAEAIRVA